MAFKEKIAAAYNELKETFLPSKKEAIKKTAPYEEEIPTVKIEKEKEGVAVFIKAETIACEKHLENEDSFIINSKNGVAGVLDGMGGHSEEVVFEGKERTSGSVAANESAFKISEVLDQFPLSCSENEAWDGMQKAFFEAQKHLKMIAKHHPEMKKMGTTASVLKLAESGKKIILGQIGDSRVYCFRDGKLKQISPEDSYVAMAKKYNLIKSDQDVETAVNIDNVFEKAEQNKNNLAALKELSGLIAVLGDLRTKIREKASQDIKEIPIKYFRNYVTNSLTPESPPRPNIITFDAKEGDIYLISSDGVHDNLLDLEIENVLKKHKDNPQNIAKEISFFARGRSDNLRHPRAKDDDITVAVLKIEKGATKETSINLKKEEKQLKDFEEHSHIYSSDALRTILEQVGKKLSHLDAAIKKSPEDKFLIREHELQRKWEAAAAAALREKTKKQQKVG
jgi:serine/threonine protein phosphatase PrpC